ncbi:MAG: BamA/TamA family outer membrane protein [Firmicutes bacterium]|nr:BamA/TamA family outer membrane protein [Bacillota bacterium]
MTKKHIYRLSLAFFVSAFLSGCSTKERFAEGEMEIKKVSVVTDNPAIDTQMMRNYVRQLPGLENGKRQHHAYDSLKTRLTCEDLVTALANQGYLHADVSSSVLVRPKTAGDRNPKCDVFYFLHPNEPYFVRDIRYDIRDARIDTLLREEMSAEHSSIAAGKQFSVADLNAERSAIAAFLQDRGYYKFNKEFIRFEADTVPGENTVDLTLQLLPYRANNNAREEPHPCYMMRRINYIPGGGDDRIVLRNSVLDVSTELREGEPFSAAALQGTYQRFSRLQALRYTNIRFREANDTLAVTDSAASSDGAGNVTESSADGTPVRYGLDCDIQLSSRKPNSISVQPEGTNTAGDLGAAVSLTYSNRNLFHGSETLSLQLRGAYEAITKLEGYNDKNYMEYGLESKLQFPRFIAPFISNSFRRNIQSTSELGVSYNLQNRPEFHRRVFSAAWRYRWSEPNHHTSYKLDMIDLNYIYMPWISETFKHDYLDSDDNRNAILRYNYEDLFIMKIGFGLSYNNGTDAYKFSVETAGNVLSGFAKAFNFKKNDEGQRTLFNIAYAQYVKTDLDATHIMKLSPASELVFHGRLGIAWPYGNSDILPFEKRYFSGGANSVRGWAVRGLGPGKYGGTDGRIDFINQTGDIKLDLNMEYRTFLFWKFYGAAFIDVGNIWTIRAYESQPGGQFRFNEFYKQLAVAYGLGLRLNFGYFILRFDCGMKAVNPAYTTQSEHYPIFHPDLSRDFAFHFGVGYPF